MLKNKHIRDVLLLFTLLLGILTLGTSSTILNNSYAQNSSNVLAADNNTQIIHTKESDPLMAAKETFSTVKEYDQKVEDTFVDWVSDIKTQINKILQ